jgi:hypothetical protein
MQTSLVISDNVGGLRFYLLSRLSSSCDSSQEEYEKKFYRFPQMAPMLYFKNTGTT